MEGPAAPVFAQAGRDQGDASFIRMRQLPNYRDRYATTNKSTENISTNASNNLASTSATKSKTEKNSLGQCKNKPLISL